MKILATNDHDEHQNIPDDTADEKDEVEDGDEDEDELVLHFLRSKNTLQTCEYFCVTQ